jgi:hypothetical protein
MKTQKILLEQISIDDLQPRVAIDEAVVTDYQAVLAAGGTLPPVDLWHDGTTYWMSDGYHRFFAHRRENRDRIPAVVRTGTREDAAWASYAANQTHGLRRTTADKAKAVKLALGHVNGASLSDRQIAEHCGVSHPFVAKIREDLESGGNITTCPTRTGKDGKTYPVPEPKPTPCPVCGSTVEDDDGECAMCHDPKDTEPQPAKPRRDAGHDPYGNEWQDTALTDIRSADVIARHCRLLTDIKTEWLKLTKEKAPIAHNLDWQALEQEVGFLKTRLVELMPHCVCVLCGGDGCKLCNFRGWLIRSQYEQLPAEQKWD